MSYEVHAFYYPWYASQQFNGQWSHWNHNTIPHWVIEINNRYPPKQHQPPDDVAAKFYPSLGPYASNDPSVIRDHMRQLAYAGVGTIAVSWYPPNTKDDNAILFVDDFIPLILDIANEFEEKVCFHLEPYKDRSAKSVRDDLKYLITKLDSCYSLTVRYGDHPAFYRYGGKPLVYIYDSYIVPSSEWRELLSPQGSITIRNTEWDVIALGLFVSATDCSNLVNGFFDGFYTYFASRDFVFGSSPSNWRVLKDCARKLSHPELFVPSVGPGYDDTVVRPWNFRNTKHRDGGKYYQKMWEEALATDPTIVSVTSFNEWHEGTQIESAVKKQGYEDYGNDPDFYLKLTRKVRIGIEK